jgi:hypothetical protein
VTGRRSYVAKQHFLLYPQVTRPAPNPPRRYAAQQSFTKHCYFFTKTVVLIRQKAQFCLTSNYYKWFHAPAENTLFVDISERYRLTGGFPHFRQVSLTMFFFGVLVDDDGNGIIPLRAPDFLG